MEPVDQDVKSPYNLRIVNSDSPKQKLRKINPQVHLLGELLSIKKQRRTNGKVLGKLFLSIGFFISMAFVTMLFEWHSYGNNDFVQLANSNELFDDLLEIPPTEQPPPPPPKTIVQPNIVEVENTEEIKEEIKVDLDFEITEDEVMEAIEVINIEKPTVENANEIFTIVEHQPGPKNGLKGFYDFVNSTIKYPNSAVRSQVQGKVFVQFIVNANGSLSDFTVVKGIGMGCDEEAIRVLKLAEPWDPGKQRGKPVRVRMILPIHFVIQPR